MPMRQPIFECGVPVAFSWTSTPAFDIAICPVYRPSFSIRHMRDLDSFFSFNVDLGNPNISLNVFTQQSGFYCVFSLVQNHFYKLVYNFKTGVIRTLSLYENNWKIRIVFFQLELFEPAKKHGHVKMYFVDFHGGHVPSLFEQDVVAYTWVPISACP